MRTVFFLLCIVLSIEFAHNSQCASDPSLAGPCGCCPIIGGECIYYETIDGIDVSWHLCVPASIKDTFSLKQCKPSIIRDKNRTSICRTKNGTFRLFPQCITKNVCSIPLPPKNFFTVVPQCNTQMASHGSCTKSMQRFSYDSKKNECVPFNYSGCGGTSNRFLRKDKCEKMCKKST